MDVVLLGAGGHAIDIIKNIEEYNKSVSKLKEFNIIGCIDDQNIKNPIKLLLGYKVFHSMEIFNRKAFKNAYVICAVGDPVNKRIFIEKANVYHLQFLTFIHPTVLIHRSTKIGSGVLIFASSIISSACLIGDFVTVNYLCSVSHNCVLDAYVTLSPGVKVGGGSILEEGAFIGINSCCSNNIKIGSWSIVGAGSTIIKDIPGEAVVVGNPQKILRKRNKKVPAI